MDCSVLYATEYPILWVKLPSHCSVERESYDFRAQEVDSCTPVPLSQGSALIVRDNRFRYNKWLWLPNRVFLPYLDRWYFATCIWNLGKNVSSMINFSEKLVPTSSEKLCWKNISWNQFQLQFTSKVGFTKFYKKFLKPTFLCTQLTIFTKFLRERIFHFFPHRDLDRVGFICFHCMLIVQGIMLSWVLFLYYWVLILLQWAFLHAS